MKVALTGATGFIGSHVLTELHKRGHDVRALVRNDAQADTVAAAGATAGRCRPLRSARGRPPAQRCGRARSIRPAPVTRRAQTSILRWSMPRSTPSPAPTTLTSISAVFGSTGTTLPSARSPRSIHRRFVSWKEPIERRVLSERGMRGVVIVSSTAYGDGGGGTAGVLLGSPRDDNGRLVMLGTGQQHWSTVHVADLADVFARVLENDSAYGRFVVGDGSRPTVADLTEAAAVAVGAPGAVPGSDDEARARLGDALAEVLLLDQGTAAAKARAELDWQPTHPSLVEEFRNGSYRTFTV